MITNDFQSLLYQKFIGGNSEHCVKQIAPELDLAPSTLYEYCRGKQRFPIELLGQLVQATGDPQFIEVFLKDTYYVINSVPVVTDIIDHTIAMLKNMKRFGDLADTYEKSIADGVIDRREKNEIKTLCRTLMSELMGFMESI